MMPKVVLSAFERLRSIRHTDPGLTSETWFEMQPFSLIRIASNEIIITQPSSTIIVYLLGILTIGVGINFINLNAGMSSRLWWGISLLLWGTGTVLAGTSYQAFSYQIKCLRRETPAWTSWWELIYLIFQQSSLDALLVAVAYSSTTGTLRNILIGYALISATAFLVLIIIGGMIPVKALITFEFMLMYSAPVMLCLIILNTWRYHQQASPMDLALIISWISLLTVLTAYWLYDTFEITPKLWARDKRIWFSQNDVLHIGLIFWMVYVASIVTDLIVDSV